MNMSNLQDRKSQTVIYLKKKKSQTPYITTLNLT